jgi:hypothetical protein
MKTIAMYDLQGHLLEVFECDNLSEISKLIGVDENSIYNCIKGAVNSAKLRQFREVKTKPLLMIGDVSKCSRGNKTNPIRKYYKGNYICEYQNAHVASGITKISESSIHKCLKGDRNMAGGFEWKYA